MAAGYTIDSIAQSSQLTASGQQEDVIIATFVTDNGDTGSVRVPMTGDWAPAVVSAVQQAVAGYGQIRGA